MWSNTRARAAMDYGKTGPGDVREEIVIGNAYGRKPGSHGSKVILLSHAWGVEPSPQPLSPHTPALAAEQWRGWPIKCLTH